MAAMTGPLLTRPPGSAPETLASYQAGGGYEALRLALREGTPAGVVREIAESGLRGRGGAGFPTGRKWELAAASEGSPRYVVANGGEHEPGSRKDRLLVTEYPHKVLEGIVLHAFDGKTPFSAASLERIHELKKFYGLDLDSGASHRLTEIKKGRNPKAAGRKK